MKFRVLRDGALLLSSLLAASNAGAQDNSAKRVSSIVSVAVEEYAKAVDAGGKLISADEYQETAGFLADAREIAAKLPGYDGPQVRAVLDTLIHDVAVRRPPSELRLLHQRFLATLGSAGAMDLPTAPLDTAAGHALFTSTCASCHGVSGLGDGPMAKSLSTPPPAIGSKTKTPELSPSLAFNVVSVGVRGTAMASFGALPVQ